MRKKMNKFGWVVMSLAGILAMFVSSASRYDYTEFLLIICGVVFLLGMSFVILALKNGKFAVLFFLLLLAASTFIDFAPKTEKEENRKIENRKDPPGKTVYAERR